MKKYYVNKNTDKSGDYKVHHENCKWLPKPENREYLGYSSSCKYTIIEAKKKYPNSNGCHTT